MIRYKMMPGKPKSIPNAKIELCTLNLECSIDGKNLGKTRDEVPIPYPINGFETKAFQAAGHRTAKRSVEE